MRLISGKQGGSKYIQDGQKVQQIDAFIKLLKMFVNMYIFL